MSDDSEIIAEHFVLEERAGEVAMLHIAHFPPFSRLPETMSTRIMPDFVRIGESRGVSRGDLLHLLRQDVPKYLDAMRSRTFNARKAGSVRVGVLVHVAFLIGIEELLTLNDLWDALRDSRWVDAAGALMMSRWPTLATTPDEKQRMWEMTQMMQSGAVPLSWMH